MRSGFRIGRIFGITISVDWSWLFIFFLVTWNLVLRFSGLQPEWGLPFSLAIALVAALLFFGSVLVHELAHSLVARTQGLEVHDIILFLFGGVSNIQEEPPSPKAEFLIAIVGPITSFVIGGLCLVLGSLVAGQLNVAGSDPERFLAQLGAAATVLLWLGSINIILAIFNLIPGFPLDGGRVLRSALWAATKNLRKATRWASWAGQVVAWLLIAAGIAMVLGVRVPFFGTGIGGLWLAFIGWFLNSAAVQSYRQIVVRDLLRGVPVGRLARSNIPAAQPDVSVASLVRDQIMGSNERAFPVLRGDHLVGMVCLEDVRKVPQESWDATLVHEIMTPANELVLVSPQEEATDALEKLVHRDVNQMPVVQGSRLVGMLARRDILRWLQLHSEEVTG